MTIPLRSWNATVISSPAWFEQAGAEIIHGHARLSGAQSVSVGDRTYSAERILLAPGGTPQFPDIPGKEYLKSSNDMFSLPSLPGQILIVGGGYIACEFAGILNALGVNVIQIYRKELFLRGFDRDVREFVAEEMRRSGVDLRFNCDLTAVSHRLPKATRLSSMTAPASPPN